MAISQNTLIMMPGDITKTLSIKPRLIQELSYGSEQTGKSLSRLVNDALDWYCGGDLLVLIEEARVRGKRIKKA